MEKTRCGSPNSQRKGRRSVKWTNKWRFAFEGLTLKLSPSLISS
ncbi:hypothetical protein HanXRQr2_Chr14g0624181 [Helianthus annuus]|uniref:Uncharacterized protein n=1 Tax=Helianthus annuus TaxID=4232 RepID=A0A9K3E5P6_HELAN|nr:hypothetical protein HanXRQr2_Chr14g0624181 [Helianthus annuus]KAJ0838791.1 hypothetical protein HanPSC8_Chr14g0599001 [Helianthus annuus]